MMQPMRKVVGMIPARYGSTRFPGKPLVNICGKSLIQHAYERAACVLDEVIVLTDDERIFDHVAEFGKVMMSSSECPTGTDRCAEAAEKIDCDVIVNLQGDWPCLERHVIKAVVDVLGDGVMGSAAVKLDDLQSSSMVKCTIDQEGYALYFSRAPLAAAYGHLGIYSYTKEFLREYARLPMTPAQKAESLEQLKVLEHGYRIRMAVVDSALLSVDVPEDVRRVECAISS